MAFGCSTGQFKSFRLDGRRGCNRVQGIVQNLSLEAGRHSRSIVARRDVKQQSGPQGRGSEMETEIEQAPRSDTLQGRSLSLTEKGFLGEHRNVAAFWILGLLNNSGKPIAGPIQSSLFQCAILQKVSRHALYILSATL